jgi:hypothetical protein
MEIHIPGLYRFFSISDRAVNLDYGEHGILNYRNVARNDSQLPGPGGGRATKRPPNFFGRLP